MAGDQFSLYNFKIYSNMMSYLVQVRKASSTNSEFLTATSLEIWKQR